MPWLLVGGGVLPGIWAVFLQVHLILLLLLVGGGVLPVLILSVLLLVLLLVLSPFPAIYISLDGLFLSCSLCW